jgi:hypothetical protein
MNVFWHFFKGLSIYLEARIWIRIRINVMRIYNTARKAPMCLCVRACQLMEAEVWWYFD